ncbi:beta strand repeat-containing protein [Mesorhizobium sp. AaZ16]|uniref:beta strand repeat-containing protein n=1 Tax=Mesorhizobium sp. AaZ16 TaxID=3402289 RepID=UPI00374E4334
MPNIPVTWLEEFNVTLTSNPQDPDIIQLANGNILVSWSTTDDTAPGDTAGEDIVGQIFDPLGNAVGGPIRLNQNFFVDGENNSDLAALPNGGFLMVYQDNEGAFGTSLRLEQYNATGGSTSSVTIQSDAAAGAPFFSQPHVAVSSATSALVVYQQDTGTGPTIVGRIYDPSTNTVGAQISLIAFAGGDTDPDVAVLTNGNYVITGTNNEAGDNRIIIRIVNPAGGNVLAVTPIASTDGDGFNDNEASVTALAGGGFVVSYTDRDGSDTDVAYSMFNAAGTQIASGLAGSTAGTLTNNNNESVVSGLADGSFVIVLDNDEANTMEVTHVNAAGTALGTFTFSGPGTEPSITDLGDGRFAVTWESLDATGGVRMEILDTRDFVNNPAVYTPESKQIGTIFDDVFTADGGASQVFGHDGNDTITESGSIKEYFGGNGNDTLIVVSPINDDVHDGGSGNDTIDWSGASGFVVGATFDLNAGLATAGGQDEVMVSFENLIGTNNDDIIIGSGGGNILNGLDGNDTIEGGFSTDTVDAGAGNDIVRVLDGQFADDVDGGTGIDLYDLDYINQSIVINLAAGTLQVFDSGFAFGPLNSVTGIENVFGGALDDTITGDAQANVINGRGGNDSMTGGDGNDTYFVDAFGDQVFEANGVGTGNDTVRTSVSYSVAAQFVENMVLLGGGNINAVANNLNNTITGNAGNNAIDGRGGVDNMTGGNGNDTYFVDNLADNVFEANGAGTGIDTVLHSVNFSVATQFVENMVMTGAGNINAIGNNLNNTITGNNGNNGIDGRGGADSMSGGLGNDTYYIDNAGDQVFEANGAGTDLVFTSVSKSFAAQFIENITLSGAGNITTTGNGLNNIIVGNNGNNAFSAREGNDTITGNGGNDIFVFNTALGATNVDTITDYNVAADTFHLDNAIFTALGLGVLAAGAFRINVTGAAQDADDRIIYESDSGRVWYDSNGNAAGGNFLFADLAGGLALTNNDFLVT